MRESGRSRTVKRATSRRGAGGGAGAGNARSAAVAEALSYIKATWNWSGAKIGEVLHVPATTVNNWLAHKSVPAKAPLSPDVQAILTLVAIHRSLEAMFDKSENQLLWLTTKHPDFLGKSPLEQMESSMEGLIGVRTYLDFARGKKERADALAQMLEETRPQKIAHLG